MKTAVPIVTVALTANAVQNAVAAPTALSDETLAQKTPRLWRGVFHWRNTYRMLRSKDKKFIFIHIPKTGGCSIAKILEPYVAEKITWDDRDIYEIVGPKNTKHCRAVQARHRLKQDFQHYFSFAFVRNPWERIVSHYHFLQFFYPKWIGGCKSFPEWVQSGPKLNCGKGIKYPGRLIPQMQYLCDSKSNNILVNRIGRFEHIQEDWQQISQIIKVNSDLPHHNKSEHMHYSNYYDEPTYKKVCHYYGADIAILDYKFEHESNHPENNQARNDSECNPC